MISPTTSLANDSKKGPQRALVLSGGGARGAYEVGVLRYIMHALPAELGHAPRFDIISGTSVGAINAAWVAATLDEPHYCAARLEHLWRALNFQEVIRFSYPEVGRLLYHYLVESKLPGPLRRAQLALSDTSRPGGFLHTGFFDRLVRHEIPFRRIEHNLASGHLRAASVTATDIISGQTTVFVQSHQPLPPWTRDRRRIARAGPITPKKVLASAAIPMLFPSVQVHGRWYCDGALRQNTPISPALRLGADRLLVISLKSEPPHARARHPTPVPEHLRRVEHPDLSYVLGKVLDALLLDPLDYDLSVLNRVNAMLRYGEEAFGEERFLPTFNDVIRSHRGQGYRVVEPLLLRPSRDLGELAASLARTLPESFWGSAPLRRIGQRATETEGGRESDLLSYVLFDGQYTGELIDMGYEDAAARHEELVGFFRDEEA
ncbi:patatin-like phospholipase family protein [Bradymonadaceae bacterium TMQ3]|nr:patatin-like phospholipase family protein [Bradymonadaceae bacterium TMQ3]